MTKPSAMLKPAAPLLWLVGVYCGAALVLGTLAALSITVPEWLIQGWWGALSMLTIVALVDAVSARRLPLPIISRQVPGNLALGRWSEVRLSVTHGWRRPVRLTLFDHVPAGLEFENLPQVLTLQPGTRGELGYRVRPVKRGLFDFLRCEFTQPSPMRLWTLRRYCAVPGSTRVYPDFARLYGAQLLAVDNWLSQMGVRQNQRRGQGMEFLQLREFREGDSMRQIDWKATARQRVPIAREYQDERDQQIVFMLDCGRRMRSHDGDLAHFDHALNACLLLSYVALRQGDAVGLATFAGDQQRYLAPVKGAAQLNVLLNAVYDLDSTQRPADYNVAATQLLGRQKRRALVVLVSNLRDEDDEQLLNAVRRLSRQHRVLVASLREEILDAGRQSPVQSFDQALTYCGTVDYLNARDKLHDRLIANGIPVLDTRPSELGPALINRYMKMKKAGSL